MKEAEVASAKEEAAKAEAAAMMPAKVLSHAIVSRGIKLTAPQVRMSAAFHPHHVTI